jgi:soluble lytic murein transglycosylase-like protein
MLKCQGSDNTVSYATDQIAGTHCASIKTVLDRPAAQTALYRNGKTSIAFSGNVSSGRAVAPSASKPTPHPARRLIPLYSAPAHFDAAQTPSTRTTKPLVAEPRATMYSYVDNGIRYYSSSRPAALPANALLVQLHFSTTCFLCAPPRNVDIATLMLNTRAYQREIEAAALDFGVDQAIVRAVIHAESAFEPHAISAAGAQGLMQLMPATAVRFGVRDAFDAAQNIRGGVQYLAWLLRRFNGNLDEALAGYNAGENAVGRYNDVPPYPQTQYYVSRVKLLAARYRNTQ